MTTEILERPDVDAREFLTDQDDPSKFSHYVDRSKYDLMAATVEGTVVVAICGHEFVPHQDHAALPVCPRCRYLAEYVCKP